MFNIPTRMLELLCSTFSFFLPGCSGSPDENFELAASRDHAHTQDVNCVAWNPKQVGLLASCSDDGEVKIWQLEDMHQE